MAVNGSPDEQFSARSLSAATHRVTGVLVEINLQRGLARGGEARREGESRDRRPRVQREWEIFVMKYGGTNDTRIKAGLRNEAELKSRRARKRG